MRYRGWEGVCCDDDNHESEWEGVNGGWAVPGRQGEARAPPPSTVKHENTGRKEQTVRTHV